MIDERNKIIYVDYSTLAVFSACKEKCRLGNVRAWRKPDIKLDFGHAIHAGWSAYYDALAGGFHHEGRWIMSETSPLNSKDPILAAKAAFIRDMGQSTISDISVEVEADERRSLERGLALLDGYFERWKGEPYDNILRADGSPLVEVGFRFYLCQFREYAIWVVGYIDRIMRNRYSGRPTIFEGKTTTLALSQYIQQVSPNHQISIYYGPANTIVKELGMSEIRETVWDCIFVSDRKPNYGKSLVSPLMMYGVDIEKDYARQTTTRSKTDFTEVLQDFEETALEYAGYLTSSKTRWPRTAPGQCNAFGGCRYRSRCRMNIDEVQEIAFMQSEGFVNVEWAPWKKIVGENA